jgi:hypothetical protein
MTPYVLSHEWHVVAANLGLGHFRVLQEEQVVDRDDVLRAPARDDQRVR